MEDEVRHRHQDQDQRRGEEHSEPQRHGQRLEELRLLTESDEECNHPGSNWTRSYGIACMNCTLAYLEEHGNALVKIAEDAAKPVSDAAE